MAMTLAEPLGRTRRHQSVAVEVDRRLMRAAWLGLALLATGTAYLWYGWRGVQAVSGRPAFFIVGWPLVRATVLLGGHTELALRLLLAAAGSSVTLAAATRGFCEASAAGQLGIASVATSGFVAVVPFVLAALVAVVNLVAWVVVAVVAWCS